MDEKMKAPQKGVAVRMYCLGHGDCFLLAFPREGGGDPVYVLIDCGYKPGSPDFLPRIKSVDTAGNTTDKVRSIDDTVKHIAKATGSHLDLVIITHEHQDHLNGFWKESEPYFQDFEIEEAWLAWTEDPTDPLANELRRRHHDQLLGLVQARRQLAEAVGAGDLSVGRLDRFLSLEFGGESDAFNLQELLALSDPGKSDNKQSLKLVKDKAIKKNGLNAVKYLSPGGKPRPIPGSAGIRTFALGPPRKENLLNDEDPVGSESFPVQGAGTQGLSYLGAVQAKPGEQLAPFAEQYRLPVKNAFEEPFFRDFYGSVNVPNENEDKIEAPSNSAWRRIDAEWRYSAESLALRLNTGINNTSLVLAFELPDTKKVLLFAGDAQRGNWISWDDYTWLDGEKTLTAREILGRTVLYKVGHHGSHNATLAGKVGDDYPNLFWMGMEAFAVEFTAMIPAVNQWALTKNDPPWRHPLPAIKKALQQKAQGRVLQMDEPQLAQPDNVPDAVWNEFLSRVTVDELYFEYKILDK